jgi:hypothetical protein
VAVHPTRRNSRRKLKYTPEIKRYYRKVSRASNGMVPPLGALTERSVFTAMVGGVKLNGRLYEQGCTVTYMPHVVARGNRDGVGGREGSSASTKVGVVNMFYVFDQVVIVDLTDLPVLQKCRSMLIVKRYEPEYLDQFKRIQTLIASEGRHLVHIDSITAKAHTAPHFDCADHMCILPMWDAR